MCFKIKRIIKRLFQILAFTAIPLWSREDDETNPPVQTIILAFIGGCEINV